ncbi:RICIN domain-containing protein [Streptomyces bottropensis]|uniref:RICIN domain-containing protein n=1 Tax=Streptomyces bottropensis TaxID=42235 RepID=UPI00382FF043
MRTRRTRNVITAVLAGGLMAVASPALADTQSPKSSEPTPLTSSGVKAKAAAEPLGLRNLKSQKYLQPSGGSTSVGANLVQQPLSSGAWQSWWLVADGSFTTFWNDNSGLNAGINGASTAAGAVAIQANPSGDLNQDWTLNWRNDSVFELKNRKSGLCLGISGGSTANGAVAAQFGCDGSTNQGWSLITR